MRLILIIILSILTNPSFSQVDKLVLQDFFNKREITSKLEVSTENVQIISEDIGVWSPQDLKVLFQDSIINRGDIGLEENEKRKHLEENFEQKDFDFIEEQLNDIRNPNKWASEIHNSKSLITLESYDKGKMWIYTVPLFNKNLDFCIIKISYYCGNMCAFSSVYSFNKTEDEIWKVDKNLYSYIPSIDNLLLPKEVLNIGEIEIPFCNSEIDSFYIGKQVKIIDKKQVYDYLCQSSNKETDWPNIEIKRNSGVCSNNWDGLENGSTAKIVWRFKNFKSSSGYNVYLIKLDNYYVAIGCSGIQIISDE